MITYQQIRENEEINTYIRQADVSLFELGYTEHGFAHVTHTAEIVKKLLTALGFDPHTVEIAQIAAYLHDIGNVINRVDHSQSGALMAFRLLDRLGMNAADLSSVITAIGNHDEGTSVPVSAMAAALILADKSDVRRSRVRYNENIPYDIHDRVNYSVESSELILGEDRQMLTLSLVIDLSYGSVMDYFEIFLERMQLCQKAAKKLGLTFRLVINGQTLL